MSKDDMTPYDLACIMALQGVLAANAGRFHDPKEVAADAIHCVNALFAELAKKKEAK
jgi:hypothetical protein